MLVVLDHFDALSDLDELQVMWVESRSRRRRCALYGAWVGSASGLTADWLLGSARGGIHDIPRGLEGLGHISGGHGILGLDTLEVLVRLGLLLGGGDALCDSRVALFEKFLLEL